MYTKGRVQSNRREKRMISIRDIRRAKLEDNFNKIINIVMIIVLPLILIFFGGIIQRQYTNEALGWMFTNLGVVIINLAIIYIAFFALKSITNSPVFSYIVTFVLYLILPIISRLKYDVRGEVLLVNDFGLINNMAGVASFAEFSDNFKNLLILIVLFLIYTAILIKLENMEKGSRKTAAVFFLLSFAFTLIIFITPNVLKFMGVNTTVRYSPNLIHEREGTLLGLYSNYELNKVEEPEDYSKERIYQILDMATAKKAEEPVVVKTKESGEILGSGETLASGEKIDSFGDKIDNKEKKEKVYPNIVMIMSESFCDPNQIDNVTYSKDPIEYVRKLSENKIKKLKGNVISGKFISSTFAGGTSNIEYEAFTGTSSAFLPYGYVPYTDLEDKMERLQTIQKVLKNNGYKTVAMHSYDGTFYNRHKIYPNIGFDVFIEENDLKNVGYYGKYVGDITVYENIINQLENNKKKPVFIWALTMQNHTPYTAKNLDSNSLYIDVKSSMLSEVAKDKLTGYVNQVYESSNKLETLINYLEKSNRPTILLFYGDHMPGLYEVYADTNMITTQDTTKWTTAEMKKMHTIPYFIYQNFDNENKLQKTDEVGAMNLGNMLLNLAGVEKSSYFKFLDTVNYTSIRDRLFVDLNGNAYEQPKEEYNDIIEEQKMLLYDMVYGMNYIDDYENEKLNLKK